MKPTPQQQAAITTHDRNIIVVAGAGSGKTFVLVQRFLALLDANPDWPLNALVAITFTRKAAGEMRDRVRQGLQERYQNATSDAERTRWSGHLSAMDSARIDTIHGLCGDILRANAAEARLDPKFDVVDEVDSMFLLQNAIDETLAEVANTENHPSVPLFNAFSEFQIRQELERLSRDDLPEQPDDILAMWREEQGRAILEAAQGILKDEGVQAWLDEAPHIAKPSQSKKDAFLPIWLKALDCAEKLKSDSPDICLEAMTTFIDSSQINFRARSGKNWDSQETFDQLKDWVKNARSLAENALKTLGDPISEYDETAAGYIPMWLYLVNRLKEIYRALKDDQSVLDFDDLESRTVALLQTYPHVATRYRGREFKHLLVDEFQDTNARQWAIVKYLAGLDQPGTMFVVGDPKQSIYAFRGADVSVFEQVKAEITTHGGQDLDLSESRRTHLPLMQTFNHFFERILTKNDQSPVKAYEIAFGIPMDAARKNPPQSDLPHVEVWGFEGGKSEGYRRFEAQKIAEKIRELVENQHPVYDKATDTIRPIQYGDFALLFRAMTNANLYEDALREAGISYITVAGRGYYNRQEINDLLNLLRALYNRGDNLSLAGVLRSPIFGISDDTLYALRLDNAYPVMWDTLHQPVPYISNDEQARINAAHDILTELQRIAGRVTISELLRHALNLTGYLATLSGLEDGTQRRSNVEKLLLKAQSLGKVTLSEFTYYLGELSDSAEVREGDAALEVSDVVQLMSVHKSKGLEFPVVILPDSARKSGGGGNPLVNYDANIQPALIGCKVLNMEGKWERPFAYRQIEYLQNLREEAESRRLLYVAATRARDMLIISGKLKTNGDADGWLGWIQEAIIGLDPSQVKLVDFTVPDEDENEPYRKSSGRIKEVTMWDDDRVKQGSSLGGETLEPALLAPIEVQRPEQARHLAATSIADLGSAEETLGDERVFYRGRFRRKVLYDAPSVIKPLVDRREQRVRVSPRQIGEIVHTALQYWRFPESEKDQTYRRVLMGYAWEQGIASQRAAIDAVDKAIGLLQKFQRSRLYKQLESATEIYRELPFIYENQRFIVHGIIDVLFQQADGTWVVVDYKTASVLRPYESEKLNDHARRYQLQVGMYADAVQKQLGQSIIPQTKIHYIRYGQTIDILEADWRASLQKSIPERIRNIVEDEADEARSLTLRA